MVGTTLPAGDLNRARAFYRDVLGLEPDEVSETGSLRYSAGDTGFMLFASAGEPSGTHTQMAFQVDDIEAAAAELRANGVVFEDVEGLEQVDGIAGLGGTRGGWFKDSEGNMLAVVQMPE